MAPHSAEELRELQGAITAWRKAAAKAGHPISSCFAERGDIQARSLTQMVGPPEN